MKKLCIALVPLLFLSGCASFGRAERAGRAKYVLQGKSREQILSCMGPSERSEKIGKTEVWSYSSGGDSVGTAIGTNSNVAIGTVFTKRRYCVINISFAEGIVDSVSYSGRTGGWLSGGEQCAFALDRCLAANE